MERRNIPLISLPLVLFVFQAVKAAERPNVILITGDAPKATLPFG